MGLLVIAEIGSNWRGAPDEPLEDGRQRALRLIKGAEGAGADAAKFQVFSRELYPQDHPGHALLAANELPRAWLPELAAACTAVGIEFLATPFDLEAVTLLRPLVQRWKISSYELRHRKLLQSVGATGLPALISTGMATAQQAYEAEQCLKRGWRRVGPYPGTVTLLHCVSSYPAAPGSMNLRVMAEYNVVPQAKPDGARWRKGAGKLRPMGLSDHTAPPSCTAAIMAVAYGATVIETHITEDGTLQGPDHHFARTIADLRQYVAAVREAEAMLGDGVKRPMPGEDMEARWNPSTGRRGGWGGETA